MHFNPYGGAGAQVAADLATLSLREDAGAAEVLAVTREHAMSVTELTDGEAALVLHWSRRLWQVFGAAPQERVGLVNDLLTTAACRPYISCHDGKPPHLHYSSPGAGGVERVYGYTAGGLAHLVCEEPDRLGLCAREGCGVAYVDTSRNGRRRYCSTRCGTRVAVAGHRARRSGA
ncbi:CGNR zinc finger domain-containing protein [Amycolatopsis sp. PS_44_ISF1]|uniref:CGNR zinc finger domain-containing protein n=1 Tax=Amycolatopsis sp. PS_44_ISF1 TaxID=2974917 RepID=UPI0028DF45D4|nr:CGNR zinc finger domain-containing protein [Amycolatopsis sp. PS_44_ISF1]MDT8912784.1 CGNR zinc finger domain-containing protein [Amycolatopsis sp. PS_44_ISF1]